MDRGRVIREKEGLSLEQGGGRGRRVKKACASDV